MEANSTHLNTNATRDIGTGGGAAAGRRRRLAWAPYLMSLPIVLVLIVFTAYPFVYNLTLSTRAYILSRPQRIPFVGLDNFANILKNFYFQQAVGNTFLYGAMLLVGTTLLGFTVALLMARSGRMAGLLRVLVIVPWAIPPTVAGIIWKWIWSGDFGLLNGVLFNLGIIQSYQAWLADPTTALLAVAVAAIWREFPLTAILLLGGLQSIPGELYEAAQIDGGNAWKRILHVTLPMLKPFLLVVLVFQTINALVTFDLLYVMTGGGPGTATQLLSWYAYSETFKFLNVGNGSAMGFVLAAINIAIVAVYLRIIRSEEVY